MRDAVPPSPDPVPGEPPDAVPGEPPDVAAGQVRWRVSPALPWLKLGGAAVLALIGAGYADDSVRQVLTVVGTLAVAAWAARDLLTPVRVAADAAGVTVVTGYASRRLVPWERVERIRVDNRSRLGLRTETLEIDAGETLHLFSAYDLGAPPAEVAARLAELRSRLPGA